MPLKTTSLLLVLFFASIAAFTQPTPQPEPRANPGRTIQGAEATPAKPQDTANYIITVKWTDPKGETKTIQLITSEGSFTLDTIQASVRIDDNDIPTTVSINGTITPVNTEKGVLKLFLGRTVPYVSSTYNAGAGKTSSSYQQLRVGLSSTFTVKFGKSVVIQADENGEVSVVVKREET
jgi:hypothetical protein